MARVSIEEYFLISLLNFKVNRLKEEINGILSKWDYISSNKFLKHAKDGTLLEAEMDAIELINLIEEREQLVKKKRRLSEFNVRNFKIIGSEGNFRRIPLVDE